MRCLWPSAGPLDAAGLADFLRFPAPRWLRASMVSTIDGAAAGSDGRSESISSPADRRVYAANRRNAQAILVGAGTARSEDYQRADRPLVVVSNTGRCPSRLAVPSEDPHRRGLVVLATTRAADVEGEGADIEVWRHGHDTVDLAAVLETMHERGWGQVLCEGGPRLLGALITADLLDEVCLTTSPRVTAGEAARVVCGEPVRAGAQLRWILEEDSTLVTGWRVTRE